MDERVIVKLRTDWKYRCKEFLRAKWERTIGMKLAIWLSDRHPEWCWADLCVHIGMGYDLLNWNFNQAVCKFDCEKNGACWCGKMVDDKHPIWQDERPKQDATELF